MKSCLQGALFLVRPTTSDPGQDEYVPHLIAVCTAKYSQLKSAEKLSYASRSTGIVCSVYLKYEVYGRLPQTLSP